MRLLALAAATRRGGAALVDDETGSVASVEFGPPLTGGAGLLPAARECLRRSGLTVADLDALAVCRGPGSFTGLRVGLATALGLAEGRGLPITAPGSLEILYRSARDEIDPVAETRVLLEAGRGLVYTRSFSGGKADGPAELIELTELTGRPPAEVYLGGFPDDWTPPPGSRLIKGHDWVRPVDLAEVGLEYLHRGDLTPSDELKPLYLKTPAARPM